MARVQELVEEGQLAFLFIMLRSISRVSSSVGLLADGLRRTMM